MVNVEHNYSKKVKNTFICYIAVFKCGSYLIMFYAQKINNKEIKPRENEFFKTI